VIQGLAAFDVKFAAVYYIYMYMYVPWISKAYFKNVFSGKDHFTVCGNGLSQSRYGLVQACRLSFVNRF
jgi:hypothetical protein